MSFFKKNGCGILLCVVLAGIATCLCKLSIGSFSFELIGAPVLSILMGMLLTFFAPGLAVGENLAGGIKFTSKKILQWAVIILGFSLNLGTIAKVGGKSLPVIVCTISTSLIVAYLLMKVMKINPKTACLIGVGSSICGGSAIAATAPVIEADDEDVAQAISVIFLFNVIAALVFPAFGHAIGFGTEGFAVFAGTAVNDTSSVTATAATIIPITLVLALYRTKKVKTAGNGAANFSIKKIFPWFILYFIGAALITTVVGFLPESGFASFYNDSFVMAMKWLAKFFIAMAMGAIGLNTNIVNLVKKGGKPILLGFCCWVSITAMSIGVQYLTGIFATNI